MVDDVLKIYVKEYGRKIQVKVKLIYIQTNYNSLCNCIFL